MITKLSENSQVFEVSPVKLDRNDKKYKVVTFVFEDTENIKCKMPVWEFPYTKPEEKGNENPYFKDPSKLEVVLWKATDLNPFEIALKNGDYKTVTNYTFVLEKGKNPEKYLIMSGFLPKSEQKSL